MQICSIQQKYGVIGRLIYRTVEKFQGLQFLTCSPQAMCLLCQLLDRITTEVLLQVGIYNCIPVFLR